MPHEQSATRSAGDDSTTAQDMPKSFTGVADHGIVMRISRRSQSVVDAVMQQLGGHSPYGELLWHVIFRSACTSLLRYDTARRRNFSAKRISFEDSSRFIAKAAAIRRS